MLAEHQVRFLLEHCEAIVGRQLTQIRGNLRSKHQARHAIWELILIDSAAEVGPVQYEPVTAGGKALDIFLAAEGGLWIEAAFLERRFRDVLDRQEAFTIRLRKEEKRHGISVGSVQRDFYGTRSTSGFDVTVPLENELKSFFGTPEVREFFREIARKPAERRQIDLGSMGATVVLRYIGPRVDSIYTVGGSPVIEAPRTVEEHALFRVLDEKGAKYRNAGIVHPVVIHVATELSPTINRLGSVREVTNRDAIAAALNRHPVISGVVLFWLESRVPVFGLAEPRQPRVEGYFNDSNSVHPLSKKARDLLQRMRFDRVDYGELWNEWEGATTVEERLDRLGGTMHTRMTKGGFAVTIPVDLLVRALGAGAQENVIDEAYRVGGAENPFRRARAEGRRVIAITLLPHNKRLREPPMMEVEFGETNWPLLQVKGS